MPKDNYDQCRVKVTMTSDEKWYYVSGVLTDLQKQSDRLNDATEGLMIAPESPLLDVQAGTESMLIASLSLIMGDDYGWISWFVYECDYGRSPMEAGEEGEMKLIDTHEKLRELIRA